MGSFAFEGYLFDLTLHKGFCGYFDGVLCIFTPLSKFAIISCLFRGHG